MGFTPILCKLGFFNLGYINKVNFPSFTPKNHSTGSCLTTATVRQSWRAETALCTGRRRGLFTVEQKNPSADVTGMHRQFLAKTESVLCPDSLTSTFRVDVSTSQKLVIDWAHCSCLYSGQDCLIMAVDLLNSPGNHVTPLCS